MWVPRGGRLAGGFGNHLDSDCLPGTHLELSQYILRHVVLGQGVHHEVLVPGRPLTRPVLGTFLPAHFSQLGQHHHDGTVVFPKHSPEVLHCLIERSLGGDVGVPDSHIAINSLKSPTCLPPPVSISVYKAGVDVVTALDASQWHQTNPAGLEG